MGNIAAGESYIQGELGFLLGVLKLLAEDYVCAGDHQKESLPVGAFG